ncbi:MAG: DUF4351 domain-containing protein [Synechococcaceae cyanobacterium SM2_3_1]|nr:DUF4351 domain-containing protein [Synechococcaceae cyanobacterium SM2_3_1]
MHGRVLRMYVGASGELGFQTNDVHDLSRCPPDECLKRESLDKPDLPFLWILTPTASEEILSNAQATIQPEEWGAGVYFLAPLLRTALVVIHHFPLIRETLWLRLLGRGKVQQQTVTDLLELAPEDPMRQNVLRALSNCRIGVSTKQEELEEEERELIMNLSPAFLEWEKSTLNQGRQQGGQEGKREEAFTMAKRVLNRRVGSIESTLQQKVERLSTEKLEELVETLFVLTTENEIRDRLEQQNS